LVGQQVTRVTVEFVVSYTGVPALTTEWPVTLKTYVVHGVTYLTASPVASVGRPTK
jgi:hypothetical protein